MKIVNKEEWDQVVEKNTKDPYSAHCINWAINWANLMEPRIEAGEDIVKVADETRFDCCDGGSGFQYGMVVYLLSKYWEYGEPLRVWHYLDTQIGNEGERANQKGNLSNPALLNVLVDD